MLPCNRADATKLLPAEATAPCGINTKGHPVRPGNQGSLICRHDQRNIIKAVSEGWILNNSPRILAASVQMQAGMI